MLKKLPFILVGVFALSAFTPATVTPTKNSQQTSTKPETTKIEMLAEQKCTKSHTSPQKGSWINVRELVDKDTRAKCYKSKCDIVWQHYKEEKCAKTIIKRTCSQKDVHYVKPNQSCNW